MMAHVVGVTGRCLHRIGRHHEIVAAYRGHGGFAPGLARSRDRHIVAGLFQQMGTPRFDFWLEILVKIFTALCVSVFTYQTFLAALRQTRAGEVWLAGTMYIPVWPSRWILPVSGVFMVVYLVLRVISDVAGAVRR